MPSVALDELEHDAGGLIFKVMESRAYARVKQAYDNAKSKKEMPKGKLADLVKEFDFAPVVAGIERDLEKEPAE